MDDDDDYGIEDDADSLDLGNPVIVHTVDESYETGILLSAGENGVRLRVTHRVEPVVPKLTVGEKAEIQAVVVGMKRRDLLACTWEIIGARSLLLSRKVAESLVAEDLSENMLKGKGGKAQLIPLTRTVNTFMPWDSVTKIVSFTEWEEEQLLRPLEASLAEKADG